MKTCAASYKDIFLNYTGSVFITAEFSIFSSINMINYFNIFRQ